MALWKVKYKWLVTIALSVGFLFFIAMGVASYNSKQIVEKGRLVQVDVEDAYQCYKKLSRGKPKVIVSLNGIKYSMMIKSPTCRELNGVAKAYWVEGNDLVIHESEADDCQRGYFLSIIIIIVYGLFVLWVLSKIFKKI